MKLVKKQISEKDGDGSVTLRAEEAEDIWHIYNMVSVGDRVGTTTMRKVIKESSTGSTNSKKLRMNLTIKVEKCEFDPDKCLLRLNGKNCEENEYVKMGAYHTIDLERNKNFTIYKHCWDTIVLERLEDACNPAKSAELGAIVMQQGLANICLMTGHMTITRAKIEMQIPKKRAGRSGHAKSMTKFYEAVYQAVLRHLDFSVLKCVLLASPGFVKDDFFTYMTTEAVRRDDRIIMDNKAKFILCHTSTGHKRALTEALSDPGLQAKLSDTKAASEVQILESFFTMLTNQPERAYYGFNHVSRACEHGAIDALLISDQLFRHKDFLARKKYVELVEQTRAAGGSVYVFSSMHTSGQQLQQITGIAALLRFPMPEIEDEDVETDSDDESDNDGGVHGLDQADYDPDYDPYMDGSGGDK